MDLGLLWIWLRDDAGLPRRMPFVALIVRA